MADLVVARYLQRLLDRHADMPRRRWTTYPPDLPAEAAAAFGISLVTVDGQAYEAGDTRVSFPIQSISKALSFALALDRHGPDVVAQHVDVEPTGVTFTSFDLDPDSGLPLNPMVNGGAIAVCGLLDGLDQVLAGYGRFAGRDLTVDDAMWQAELTTGHRNRALAHLLKSSGALGEGDPELALTLYLGQCSAQVDCFDLAMVAATLANGGINPVTGTRAAGHETVRGVLSVMTSCGMYDAAGQWLFTVGMPAKSGVAGSVIAVLPGRFGLAVYSPPLDEHGNSIRGLDVCRDLSDDMALHMIESGRRGPSPVRARYTLRERTSKRVRSAEAYEVLDEIGDRAVVFELQGELLFSEAEFITREAASMTDDASLIVLDFRRVRTVPAPVIGLLEDLHEQLASEGVLLLVSSTRRLPELRRRLEALEYGPDVFGELDLALERCEALLLADVMPEPPPRHVALADHDLLTGLAPEAVERLQAGMEHRRYPAGTQVVTPEDETDELLLILSGELSVMLDIDEGAVRVGTLSAGMLLGEMSLLTERRRVGHVDADTNVEAYALPREHLDALRDTDPALQAAVLENLVRILSRRAEAMRDELALAAE